MKKYESRTAGGAVAFADTGMMLTDKRLTGVDDASVLLLNIFECHASIIPVDRTRNLLPGNGDLRPQKDRKMSSCVINQIRRRYQKISPLHGGCFFVAAGAARTGAKRPFVYAALPRRRRFFRCLSNQKNLRNGSPLHSFRCLFIIENTNGLFANCGVCMYEKNLTVP